MEDGEKPRQDDGPDGAGSGSRPDGGGEPEGPRETLEETIARLKREALARSTPEGPPASGREGEEQEGDEAKAGGKEEAAEDEKEEADAGGKDGAEEETEADDGEKGESEPSGKEEGGRKPRARRSRKARRVAAAVPVAPAATPREPPVPASGLPPAPASPAPPPPASARPAHEGAGFWRAGGAGKDRIADSSGDSSRRERRVRMTSERRIGRVIGTGLGLVLIIFAVLGIVLDMLEVIPAGHKGVIITSPGGPSDIEINEGYQFDTRYIWADVVVVEYRTQTVHFIGQDYADDEKGSVQIITNDSMPIFLDLSVIYHIQEDRVADLVLENGVDYQHRIIYPYVRSIARDVASRYQALDIIGEKRSAVETTIQQNIITKLAEKYIIVEGVPMRDVRIPANLESAIINKKVAEQNVLTEQYNLIARQYIANQTIVNAQANATAYIIEQTGFANGTVVRAVGQAQAMERIIAALNSTDLSNRTKDYLTWAYIQALTDPNTKVKFVVVPASGAPIILDVSGEQR
ncbi:MAG: hypothetical protein FJ149_12700 [Euryarchaeota archaeon]|nr:hypothetical protein [Euryarchaeota archaeon]